MDWIKRSARIGMITLATTSVLALGAEAFAASKSVLLNGGLFGNIPNVTIRGVQAGGAPWVVKGHVKLTNNHLWASGKWLVVPKTGYMANGQPVAKAIAGTTVGVNAVVADITFANASSVITAPVKLNANGDFSINTSVKLPKGAAQPVVLIGPGAHGKIKAWFASSNFLMDYGTTTGTMSGNTKATKSSGGKKAGW